MRDTAQKLAQRCYCFVQVADRSTENSAERVSERSGGDVYGRESKWRGGEEEQNVLQNRKAVGSVHPEIIMTRRQ